MYLIVGLGNRVHKYEKTRHNVGFVTVDVLAGQLGIKVNKLKFKSLIEREYWLWKGRAYKAADVYEPKRWSCDAAINFYKPDHDKIL